jgi:hypothetical protein
MKIPIMPIVRAVAGVILARKRECHNCAMLERQNRILSQDLEHAIEENIRLIALLPSAERKNYEQRRLL